MPLLTPLFVALAVGAPTDVHRTRVELKADEWFNAPSIRIPDDREYVLFFFTSTRDREVKPFLERLNHLHQRGDVVVVGLTAESKERTKKYIDLRKIKFTVGAHSRAYKKFNIKEFPQLLFVDISDEENPVPWEPIDLLSLERWLPPESEGKSLVSQPINGDSPAEVLRQQAQHGQTKADRRSALEFLRDKIEVAEFLRLCDELAEAADDPFDRGEINYQRQLADPGVTEKEARNAPSTQASQAYRQNPDAPQWKRLEELFSATYDPTPVQLLQDYYAHLTDDPADLLIRKRLADAPSQYEDKELAQAQLKDMLLAEPDSAIRLRIVWSFIDVYEPGDLEAASFLEQQRTTEPNVRLTRPSLDYVIRYLRTGEE